jgi:hypothetical protein
MLSPAQLEQRRQASFSVNRSGVNKRGIVNAFRARAWRLDPTMTPEQAAFVGALLRKQNLSDAGKKGMASRYGRLPRKTAVHAKTTRAPRAAQEPLNAVRRPQGPLSALPNRHGAFPGLTGIPG